MKLVCLLLATATLSLSAHAALWETTAEWDHEKEQEFSAWIDSEKVYSGIFKNDDSPYQGAQVDCADASYGLRVIFSYENGLPFKVKNAGYRRGTRSGRRSIQFYTNELDQFDGTEVGPKRVVRFINFLAGSLGTENLSRSDSYPVRIGAVSAGDVYMYKIKKKNKFVRHSYNIKKVNGTGTFDLIYSTQTKRSDNLPMSYRRNMMMPNKPDLNHWGFKRFKLPFYYELPSYTDYPVESNYSTEQYDLAAELTEREFFRNVRHILKKYDELPNNYISRTMKQVCDGVVDRISVAQGAVEFIKTIEGQCTDYRQYDVWSTPSRDGNIKKSIQGFRDAWEEIQELNVESDVDAENQELAELMLKSDELSSEENQILLNYCEVKFSEDRDAITLNDVIKRFDQNKISFHPNDNLYRRWGEEVGRATRCVAHY